MRDVVEQVEMSLAGLALALLASMPNALAAQAPAACPDGEISYVFVDNHSVFDTDELGEDQPFLWAYRLANTVHMRTSRDFILDEVLFATGECYDPLLLAESERLLRSYPFIARVDVYGVEQPDGTWHVVVDTRDEWTTKLNVRVNFEEGVEFRGVDLTEENFLGRGLEVGAFFFERDERRDIGARIKTPRMFGTRFDAELAGGRTRVGDFFEEEVFYPFVGEVGRVAGRERFSRRESLFPYSTGGAADFTHLLLPVDEERVEVTLAGRIGEPGNLTIFGLGISDQSLDFGNFPADVEAAEEGDFDDPRPVDPDTAEALLGAQTRHTSATRFNLLFGQRNVRFIQRRGLDALTGIQDVPVGTDLSLTLGRSVGAISGGADEPDDLYTRARLFGGAAPGPLVLQLRFALQGRQVFSGGRAGDGWKDLLGEVDGLLYWQPDILPDHTLFARVAAAGGWNLSLPFQLTLGGAGAVRGFLEEDFPGARRVIASLEDRIRVRWPAPELLDFGFTVFADAGRMWPGDVPFGVDSGWKATVGGGLRIGFPTGTRGVARVDLAFPLGPDKDPGDVIFRISMLDLLGMAGVIQDRQLRRSLPVEVGPDLFNVVSGGS